MLGDKAYDSAELRAELDQRERHLQKARTRSNSCPRSASDD
jgi:hypothetical protein